MQAHEAANLFPPMSDEEMAGLVADIEEHGQREPIVLWQGKILDGRNRWKACAKLDRKPATREWDGVGSPTSYVLSMNLHRRSLTFEQRVVIGVESLPYFEAEAVARKAAAAVESNRKRAECEPPECAPGHTPGEKEFSARRAADDAGRAVGVSARSIARGAALKERAPEKFEEVKRGEITLHQATREVKKAEQAAELAQGDAIIETAMSLDPSARSRVERAELRTAFARARSMVRAKMLPLGPEAVADVLDSDDIMTRAFIEAVRGWLDKLETAMRRPLRAVK